MKKTRLSIRGELQWPYCKKMIDDEWSRTHEDRRNIVQKVEKARKLADKDKPGSSFNALYRD